MALSGSVTTGSYSNRSVTLKWTATQSVANNTSTISWELVGSGSSSGWVVVSELKVTIDGSQAYYRSSDKHTNCYNGTKLASGTKTITHSSDGTKSFTIKVEAGIYNWAINKSGSKTFTLNTIARASSISSASNVTLGNTCSVKWTPASSSFKYKVKFAIGSWSHTTDYISPKTTSAYTYTGYTIPLTVANQLPNATTGTMTAYLYTYNGSTQIGSKASKTFTIIVPKVRPTINTLSISLDNSANSTIKNWGLAVAGYTKLKFSATASGIYNSTISYYRIMDSTNSNNLIEKWKYTGSTLNYTTSTITFSGTKKYKSDVWDSRGYDSYYSNEVEIQIYPYSKPSISTFTVNRSDTNAKKVIVKGNWSYSSVNGKNAVTATLQYKKSTASNWTNYGTIDRNTNVTLTTDFDETYSYNFRLVVKDSLNQSAQDEAFVSTIAVLMDFRAGGKGLGIGKIAESDNLEVALNSIFIGDVYIKIDSSNVPLKTYIKKVINGDYD